MTSGFGLGSGRLCEPRKNSLYTLMVTLPQDENCARSPDGLAGQAGVRDYGKVAYPLRGWIGCDGSLPLQGVTVEAYSSDGKTGLASTTTNNTGRFVFPDLKEGKYRIVVNQKGFTRSEVVVSTSKKSEAVPCVIAVAEEDAR
jgi:Carboxypeptidase regulatory-like domain